MKILAVEDNPSIAEVLKDILSEEGHNVRLAASIDEAVTKTESFEPDMVLLDSMIGKEDGTRYLARIDEEIPSCRPAVIFVKAPGEMVPGDNPLIMDSVDKPFRSEDVVNAVKDVAESMQPADAKPRRTKERRSRRKKLRYKEPAGDSLESHGIEFGKSYVMFTRDREAIYRLMSFFDMRWYNLMIITTSRTKAVEERFSYGAMEVVSLSVNAKAGSTGIMEIGTMTERAKEFIDSSLRPVVIFDGFDDIVEADGINQSLMMIQQIIKGRSKTCTVALSVDGSVLTEKDRGILLRNMTKYSME